MKSRNYHVYRSDVEELKALADDYISMGRDVKIEGRCLTVFAYKRPDPPKKKVDRKVRDEVESAPERTREQRPKKRD